MKFLVFLIYTLFSSLTFAAENIEGCYQYDDVSILQIQHRIPVYTKSQKGKDKLQQLKNNKFTCAAKPNSWYLCRKFLNRELVSADQIKGQLKPLPPEICFGELRSEPTIKSQGPSLTVWDYQQDSITSKWNSFEFELLELTNIKKIVIEDLNEIRHEYVFSKTNGKYQFSDVSQIHWNQPDGFYEIIVSESYN